MTGNENPWAEALTDVHRLTGRGDGHTSAKATADCIISAFADYRMRVAEAEADLVQVLTHVYLLQSVLSAARAVIAAPDAGDLPVLADLTPLETALAKYDAALRRES